MSVGKRSFSLAATLILTVAGTIALARSAVGAESAGPLCHFATQSVAGGAHIVQNDEFNSSAVYQAVAADGCSYGRAGSPWRLKVQRGERAAVATRNDAVGQATRWSRQPVVNASVAVRYPASISVSVAAKSNGLPPTWAGAGSTWTVWRAAAISAVVARPNMWLTACSRMGTAPRGTVSVLPGPIVGST